MRSSTRSAREAERRLRKGRWSSTRTSHVGSGRAATSGATSGPARVTVGRGGTSSAGPVSGACRPASSAMASSPSAMRRSRSAAACWYIIDARGLAWPIRAMSSLVVAPGAGGKGPGRVAKIVESHSLEAGGPGGREPDSLAEVAALQRRPLLRREHVVVGLAAVPGAVAPQLGHEHRRQGHRATPGTALRIVLDHLARRQAEALAAHGDAGRIEVDLVPAEGEQLALG